jgi:hypothetical protein
MSNNIGVFIGNGDGTFQDEVEYDMGGSPEAVVLADFNGDGNLDVATADLFPDPITGDSTVSVRLGTGHGTFGDRMVTVMDGDPFGMAVGRVDAGDTLDLVVSLYSKGQVVTLLGDGTGHFTLAQPADVNLGPRGVALADYNGDGMLDVAVTTECEDILDVLFGNGDGTFQTPTPYGVGGPARNRWSPAISTATASSTWRRPTPSAPSISTATCRSWSGRAAARSRMPSNSRSTSAHMAWWRRT